MSEPHADNRLDRWERRLDRVSGAVPYVLLAVSTLLAGLDGAASPADRLATGGLAGLTAAWMAWMITLHPAWVERRRLMALFYCGLLALIGLLIARSPWFGIFAFSGYLYAWQILAPRWRVAGVTATAILSATWQAGGLPEPTLPAIASYLLVIAVIVVLVSLFSSIGEITTVQSAQRKRVIAELAATNRRLAATLEENAGLQAQVLTQAREAGVLDERQRMAGEIHDTLAQNLAGIITQLEAAAMARSWAAGAGVELRFETTGQPQPLLPDLEAALFRVAQEALTNVAKHARATRVGLTLSYLDDLVLLDVRDDGAGFSDGAPTHGLGLRAMEQRLRRVAGALEIESAPGAGTVINARVPAIAAEGADSQ